MKILLDLQGAQSQSRHRGIGRLSRALAGSIIANARGHDVHVLLNRALVDNFDELTAEFGAVLPPGSIHGFEPPGPVAEIDSRNLWRMRSAALLREATVARLRPDLLHISSLFEGFVDDSVTSVAQFRSRHAVATTLYDLIPLADPSHYLVNTDQTRFYLRRAQELKKSDLLLAISQYSKRQAADLLQIPLERIDVVSPGVDDVFRPKTFSASEERALRLHLNMPKPFLLYVGAIDSRKNINGLVEAFSLLPPALRDSRALVFAGKLSEAERDQVRQIASRVGVAPEEIIFTGYVGEADLISLYQICDAVLFPSLQEGFGLPALEGMACGAPVLVSNGTSLPEVVGREDMQFDATSARAIADRVQRVLESETLRQELRNWGPQRAALFTWTAAGARAIECFEACLARRPTDDAPKRHLVRKPRLAFFSPLPNDRSGIADYSAELLPELCCHYDVECIIADTHLTDPWIAANCTCRDLDFFESNSSSYDRILYMMGNSPFHAHMIDLMKRFPGVVVLHDFFLSDLLEWLYKQGRITIEDCRHEVYYSHGLTGLSIERKGGFGVVKDKLPVNGYVFRNALGIVFHSQFAADLAVEYWSDVVRDNMAIIPHLRSIRSKTGAARELLPSQRNDFVVCSFGIMHPRKLNHVLIEAWIMSDMGKRDDCRLIFVGDGDSGKVGYVATLRARLKEAGVSNVTFTGFVDADDYRQWLSKADLAVQLRTGSRGETSGAILDCMSAGIPVIVNGDGTAAEFPPETIARVPIDADAHALASRLADLREQPDRLRKIGASARDYIRDVCHPAKIGLRFQAAIEGFYSDSPRSDETTLLTSVAQLSEITPPQERDLACLAETVCAQLPFPRQRQILCDVTAIALTDRRTGIERVVRGILNTLIEAPPRGFRIEPVIMREGRLFYARQFAQERFGLDMSGLADDPVEGVAGDHFVALDWTPDRLPALGAWLEAFRRRGGTVTAVIYDLLPLTLPQFFPAWLPETVERWFTFLLKTADRIAAISATVAGDVERLAAEQDVQRHRPLEVGYFHLGSDLAASIPSKGRVQGGKQLPERLAARPTFLMVGTVEPRKGHSQVLAAFESLWGEGIDIGLAIVGKRGWEVDELTDRIVKSEYFGSKLLWIEDLSDELLPEFYTHSVALIAASLGEGFGLPLVEAAAYELPIIARDIPVFREVGRDHVFYFNGDDETALAERLKVWLELRARNEVPISSSIRRLTWRSATDEFLSVMFGERIAIKLAVGSPKTLP